MSSSDTTSTSTYSTSTTVYDTKPTAADMQPGSQAFQPTIHGQDNSVSFVSESPQALQTAEAIAGRSIQTAERAAMASLAQGAEEQASARELAKASTATSSEQFNKLILYIFGGVVAVAIVVGVFFGFKKHKAAA